MKLIDNVHADAVFSPCGMYRYALFRHWFPKHGKGDVLWIMLNPSTATAAEDDPTIRRCQAFARAWGFDGITVCNLFALRSTDPRGLHIIEDPVGEENDELIEDLATAAGTGLVVAAWGAKGSYRNRAWRVTRRLMDAGVVLHCLGLTADGHPRHPLYVKGEVEATVWKRAA